MMLCYDVTGVLYDAMEQPEDAIADFEAILKLRKDVAVAHLNLGLIYLTKMDSYQKYVLVLVNSVTFDPYLLPSILCSLAGAPHSIEKKIVKS